MNDVRLSFLDYHIHERSRLDFAALPQEETTEAIGVSLRILLISVTGPVGDLPSIIITAGRFVKSPVEKEIPFGDFPESQQDPGAAFRAMVFQFYYVEADFMGLFRKLFPRQQHRLGEPVGGDIPRRMLGRVLSISP